MSFLEVLRFVHNIPEQESHLAAAMLQLQHITAKIHSIRVRYRRARDGQHPGFRSSYGLQLESLKAIRCAYKNYCKRLQDNLMVDYIILDTVVSPIPELFT